MKAEIVRDLFQKIYCRLDAEMVWHTYGYVDMADISPSKQAYLDSKIKRAMSNPMDWFCELDPVNAQRFLDLLYG